MAAPRVHGGRVAAVLIAFFLAVGVAAHAFDELHDRPLGTRISDRALTVVGAAALVGAIAVGVAGILTVSVTLLPFVVVGGIICPAYNLELFGGRFHTATWFALAWGALPAWTGYWVNALRFTVAGVLVGVACAGLSVAQRRLSTPARRLRRETAAVRGQQVLTDGTAIELSRGELLEPLDGALRALSAAIALLAGGLLAGRL